MPNLLHLSADYPDSVSRKKPLAVANLLQAAPWATHRIVSLNRVVDPAASVPLRFDGRGVAACRYFGLPYGVGLSWWMDRVAGQVLEALRHDAELPALVHAHKLTFEGLIAARVAGELGVPYCVTVRGHTDHKVIAAKPGLRGRYRDILRRAGRVFYLAPWSLERLEQQLGMRLPEAILLPNICRELHCLHPPPAVATRFASVFHFRSRRVKRIGTVMRALRELRARGFDTGLDVIGAADAEELQAMEELARGIGVADGVRAFRAMDAGELGRRLPGYAGLVLPSYPETFGLAYVEALSAGIPVVHARNSGIDGYFSGEGVALAVDHRSVANLVAAMADLLEHQETYRNRVASFVAAGGLRRFTEAEVGALYRRALADLLSTSAA